MECRWRQPLEPILQWMRPGAGAGNLRMDSTAPAGADVIFGRVPVADATGYSPWSLRLKSGTSFKCVWYQSFAGGSGRVNTPEAPQAHNVVPDFSRPNCGA